MGSLAGVLGAAVDKDQLPAVQIRIRAHARVHGAHHVGRDDVIGSAQQKRTPGPLASGQGTQGIRLSGVLWGLEQHRLQWCLDRGP